MAAYTSEVCGPSNVCLGKGRTEEFHRHDDFRQCCSTQDTVFLMHVHLCLIIPTRKQLHVNETEKQVCVRGAGVDSDGCVWD